MAGDVSQVPELAKLCAELVERWDDLGAYFGLHRAVGGAETRSMATMETQVFNDSMARPRFAVLKFILESSKCVLMSFVDGYEDG